VSIIGSVGRVATRGPGGLQFPSPVGVAPAFGPGPYVFDATSARSVPSVSRCLQLIGGMCKQMPMDAYRGTAPLPRPGILRRPDPFNAASWFVQISVEDYLLSGNAVCRISSRGADGWPQTVQWLPINWVYIVWVPGNLTPDYYFYGQRLDPAEVIHVKRGADRWYGGMRGVGVVEECLPTLDRIAMEEIYEYSTLSGSAVPSVAVITPTPFLTQEEADTAKLGWEGAYGGPNRSPAILPAGTQVIPLSWSPTDTQMIEARKLSLTDCANAFNLDGYWLGAPTAGITYKTSGPQYQQILRTTLEPILADFEDVWSDAWLPRGQKIRFDRNQLLRDDLATTTVALAGSLGLVGSGIMSTDEARQYLQLSPAQADATAGTAGTIGGPDPAEPVQIAGGGGPET
jgi:HK97 family phage portal protein